MIKRSLLALAILSVAGTGVCLAQNLSVQRNTGGGWNEWWDHDGDQVDPTPRWVSVPTTIPASQAHTIIVGTVGMNNVFIRVIDDTPGRTATVEGLTFGGTAASGDGLLHIMVGETTAPLPSTFPNRFGPTVTGFLEGTGTIKSLTVTGDLLTRSRLAAKLTNGVGDRVNTTIGPGNIQVGQVYILDAVNDIHGTVHAHRADWFVSGQQVPERSIQRLVAGRWIDATIQAGGAVVLFLLAQA
jgi:hypothetical protein